jgi:hypothetical protein
VFVCCENWRDSGAKPHAASRVEEAGREHLVIVFEREEASEFAQTLLDVLRYPVGPQSLGLHSLDQCEQMIFRHLLDGLQAQGRQPERHEDAPEFEAEVLTALTFVADLLECK